MLLKIRRERTKKKSLGSVYRNMKGKVIQRIYEIDESKEKRKVMKYNRKNKHKRIFVLKSDASNKEKYFVIKILDEGNYFIQYV